jgi:hypothetical protein
VTLRKLLILKIECMKSIEKIKFMFGMTLISFAILGGLIFFLESFKIFNQLLDYGSLSSVFQGGWKISGSSIVGRDREFYFSGGGASNIPIFLGLCGLAGTFLLTSVKAVQGDKIANITNATGK